MLRDIGAGQNIWTTWKIQNLLEFRNQGIIYYWVLVRILFQNYLLICHNMIRSNFICKIFVIISHWNIELYNSNVPHLELFSSTRSIKWDNKRITILTWSLENAEYISWTNLGYARFFKAYRRSTQDGKQDICLPLISKSLKCRGKVSIDSRRWTQAFRSSTIGIWSWGLI